MNRLEFKKMICYKHFIITNNFAYSYLAAFLEKNKTPKFSCLIDGAQRKTKIF